VTVARPATRETAPVRVKSTLVHSALVAEEFWRTWMVTGTLANLKEFLVESFSVGWNQYASTAKSVAGSAAGLPAVQVGFQRPTPDERPSDSTFQELALVP